MDHINLVLKVILMKEFFFSFVEIIVVDLMSFSCFNLEFTVAVINILLFIVAVMTTWLLIQAVLLEFIKKEIIVRLVVEWV